MFVHTGNSQSTATSTASARKCGRTRIGNATAATAAAITRFRRAASTSATSSRICGTSATAYAWYGPGIGTGTSTDARIRSGTSTDDAWVRSRLERCSAIATFRTEAEEKVGS